MHYLIPPELALRDVLLAELEKGTDCLFAVAYINVAGVEAVEDVIDRRLDGARFSLRIVFRASDLRTAPAALDRLLKIALNKKGHLNLRWSPTKKFHAKAYGFKMNRKASPRIILGSANMTGGAIGPDSGELGVHLSDSALAHEAWATLESFWDQGRSVTPMWLKKYRTVHARYRRKMHEADKEANGWAAQFRTIRRFLPRQSLSLQKFFVEHTEPLSKPEIGRVEVARKYAKRESSVETGDDWTRYLNRKEAFAVPVDRNILHFHWRRADLTSAGIKGIALVRLTRRVRITDPVDGKSIWLLYFSSARGAAILLRLRDRKMHERRLRRHGLSWQRLATMQGYLRSRRAYLLRSIAALGFQTK